MRSSPLPNGTEVITRVARSAGERRVPQGALGRVVGQRESQQYDVAVVGVGTLSYRHDELSVRKSGQQRFALRRESAWAALSPCIVLETIVGSRAWGLAEASSDVDRRGVFVAPMAWTTGLGHAPSELVSADGSSTYWEVEKLLRQALRADPNTLETLFVPGARALDEMGEWLLAEREAFVSRAIYGSFARYAMSQLKKLRQSLRLAEHRTLLLAWLTEESELSLDAAAERLARAAEVEAPTQADALLLAKEHVKQLYHSLHDQGHLPRADFSALGVYARAGGRSPEAARELRPKNAYNLLRLLTTALGWLRDGQPTFAVAEPLRTRLLAIKRGEVGLAEVLAEADALTPALEAARSHSPLPMKPDLARADALLRRIRHEVARRAFVAEPGPWGTAAPPPPPLEWEEEEP